MDFAQSLHDQRGLPARSQGLGHRIAGFMGRLRFQLTAGTIIAVLAPALLRGNLERFTDTLASYDNSVAGTFCAFLLGFMIFRKVTTLPGASALMNILPAFMSAYAGVVVFFFILRLDYSRYQFLASFLFVTAFFMIVLLVIGRLRRPVLGYVPGGRADRLAQISGVDWHPLPDIQAARRERHLPLVADLKSDAIDPEWERFIAREAVAGRPVFNAKQLCESLTGRVQVDHLSENVFGHLSPDSLYGPAKRYVDAAGAALALLLLSPLMLAVALAIRLDSRGPALFRQERMGYRGEVFTVYKFRSMREAPPDAASLKADMTRCDDDRITRIGRFIRKTRIDELPQIINILKGEMSWIGPRPETLRLSNWYEDQIAFYSYRHIVRPGITGWAQVKQGHVTTVEDVREKLEYDLYYVKNFSLWLDTLIVIRTIKVILTADGAK